MTINFNAKKQSLGAGSVLQSKHTIPIEVKKFYTNVDGQVISKNDALVPVEMQTRFPAFLLGEFDRLGGYPIGLKMKPVELGVYYLTSFVNGATGNVQSIVGFTGLNDIQNRLRIGDIVLVYTDNLSAPSVFVWIVISNNYASIASILGNSKTTQKDSRLGSLFVYEVLFYSDVAAQFSEPLNLTRYDNIGNANDNQIDPLGIYRTPNDVQNNFIRMPIEFNIDQFLGINFYMLFDCDRMSFDLKIIKIN